VKHVILTSMPDAGIKAQWNAFVTEARFATHYVTPNYFNDPYVRGERFAILAVDENGDVHAALTGVVDGDKIASGLYSRPQAIFRHGADDDAAAGALMKGISELSECGKLIELHSWQLVPSLADGDMQMRPSGAETSVVMIDLSNGPDAVFANFSQTRRNEIRKAEKQHSVLIKELANDDELTELYQIYCEWNRRKGNEPDTFERMQMAAGQHENRRIFIAKADGKVIAGSFYRFCAGGIAEYAANFSVPEYQKLRPNDLIGWHAIQWACGAGLSHFSMGGSHLFLRRFGGDVMTTYRYTRDERPLGVRRLTSDMREVGLNTYRHLPEKVRTGMRRVLAK
jgi:hypothetical protein